MKFKASIREVNVIEVDEHYTSKMRSNCWSIKQIGKTLVYNCYISGSVIDRDVNGCRGILMKVMIGE